MDSQRRLEELSQLSPAKRTLLLQALRGSAVQQELAQEISQRSPDAALLLSFAQVLAEIAPRCNQAGQSLFNVVLILQNTPMPASELPSLTFEQIEIDNKTAKSDLALLMLPDGLHGWIEYSTDSFEAATVARMMEHFHTLLTAMINDPAQQIAALPVTDDHAHTPEDIALLGQNWDRSGASLPDQQPAPSVVYVAPQTPVESMLAQTWSDLLKIERIGVHDNFFELGGHSLLATQVVSHMIERVQLDRTEGAFELEALLVKRPVRPSNHRRASTPDWNHDAERY